MALRGTVLFHACEVRCVLVPCRLVRLGTYAGSYSLVHVRCSKMMCWYVLVPFSTCATGAEPCRWLMTLYCSVGWVQKRANASLHRTPQLQLHALWCTNSVTAPLLCSAQSTQLKGTHVLINDCHHDMAYLTVIRHPHYRCMQTSLAGHGKVCLTISTITMSTSCTIYRWLSASASSYSMIW